MVELDNNMSNNTDKEGSFIPDAPKTKVKFNPFTPTFFKNADRMITRLNELIKRNGLYGLSKNYKPFELFW